MCDSGKYHYSKVVKPLCSGLKVYGSSNPTCTRLCPIFSHTHMYNNNNNKAFILIFWSQDPYFSIQLS